ncbi:MAG: glycoside hydrolase family 88 protein [Verrucomicrobia bacterium]|nr:glycoside hydrolase family 88 protein [Verrucomicrobiota bacterium]
MIKINHSLTAKSLQPKLERLFDLSGRKILGIQRAWNPANGTPVFTVRGRYTSRGWTEWTQGFQFGSAVLQYDATGDEKFLAMGRSKTVELMATHVSHIGVHDHGFNNVSTYGNLLRLMREGRMDVNEWEKNFYELALKISGAVQAARWTPINPASRTMLNRVPSHPSAERGYIHTFNGPHSLFADTIRSLRALAVAHELGHVLMGEGDRKISLLARLVEHADTTATFNVYYGEGRDAYDVRGRVAHESVFNVNDGNYRCPNSQQGYSPFSTWTRGLAWIICGYAEQLEFFKTLDDAKLKPFGGHKAVTRMLLNTALATADFYIENTPTDGVPYWDTGAPGLAKLGGYLDRPADPFNFHEPVDSSAAVIAAQGLIRLGNYLGGAKGRRYLQAGLTVTDTLLAEPYLSTKPAHEGLLLHSIYHRPNGWDHVPPGSKIPRGESSMWGDYHARELALLLLREAKGRPYLKFF